MPHNIAIHFHKCIQDSQEFGSDADHMVSRVFFTLIIDGTQYRDLWANIRQAYGENYNESPIEVDRPGEFSGLLNYEAYRQATEDYFRSFISLQGTNVGIRMLNNTFERKRIMEFIVDENSPAW